MSKKDDDWEITVNKIICHKAFDLWREFRDWLRSFPGNIKAYDHYLSGYLDSREFGLHKDVIKAALDVVARKKAYPVSFSNDEDEEYFIYDACRATQDVRSYEEFWEQFDKMYEDKERFPF